MRGTRNSFVHCDTRNLFVNVCEYVRLRVYRYMLQGTWGTRNSFVQHMKLICECNLRIQLVKGGDIGMLEALSVAEHNFECANAGARTHILPTFSPSHKMRSARKKRCSPSSRRCRRRPGGVLSYCKRCREGISARERISAKKKERISAKKKELISGKKKNASALEKLGAL